MKIKSILVRILGTSKNSFSFPRCLDIGRPLKTEVFRGSLLFFCIFLSACTLENEIVKVWGSSVQVPSFVMLNTDSETTLRASFTAPVKLINASVLISGPDAQTQEIPAVWDTLDNSIPKKEIVLAMQISPKIGQKAVLQALVSDETGNTLSMMVPFVGYNAHPALLRINEVRTTYAKPKVEFIEFIVLKDGNLAGLEISNYANTTNPVWVFPACEVKKGEYLVYHLRSIEEGLINETEPGLVSGGTEARLDARDFWDIQTKAPLKPTNVIVLRERSGGCMQDAFLCAAEGIESWPTEALANAAKEVYKAGLWEGDPSPKNAFCTTGMTATRTAGRNPSETTNLENMQPSASNASLWRICATSKASCGTKNAPWT